MRQPSPRKRALLPIFMQWHEPAQPLPQCVIRAAKPKASAGNGQPFDFCAAMRRLVEDVVKRSPDFQHIQPERILLTVTQARSGHAHGLQARVTPLRFPKGALIRQRRGTTYHIQRYFLNGQEFLYVMTFCLPRFLNQSFDQKFITLFHELYHLHPEFNGDLRRHDGRYQFHTHCQREYDKGMVRHAREYLAGKPDLSLSEFLRLDFAQLQTRHGSISGIVVPRPKIIPLIGSYASAAYITPLPPNPASP